jgi:prepilin peptidase CpaA
MPIVLKILLVCTVVIAGLYDLRYRRIPNWLNVSAMSVGVLLNLLLFAGHGLILAMLGIGCALVVYIPLYLVRGMGAGDVKLMAAVGAIAGPRNWMGIFIATAVLGGFVSLIYVLFRRRLHETFWNMTLIVSELTRFRVPAVRDSRLDVRSSDALRVPHGALIAVGVITFLFLGQQFLGWGG